MLAANGAAVALVARRADRLAAVKAEIETAGGKAIAIEADVLDRAAMARAFDAGREGVRHRHHPGQQCRRRPFRPAPSTCPRRNGATCVGTNLDAVFFWAQEAARRMLAAEAKGAIVNIASVLGFGVSKGTIAYATAKAGVIQMTKALGLELAFKGVRVNAIAPGWFVTDINRDYLLSEAGREAHARHPGRPLRRRTAISTARCCCSPPTPAAYIAGTTIVVDGGQVVSCADDHAPVQARAGGHAHGLHAFARDRRACACAVRAFVDEHVLPLEADPHNFRRAREHSATTARAGAREGAGRPASGRRSRRRNTAAWSCRSSPGR